MALSGLILLSQAFSWPSPVRNAATLTWETGFSIRYPFWHLVFTPLTSVADYLTVMGRTQLVVFVCFVFILIFLFGRLRRGLILSVGFLIFLAWGVLVPRPMGRLAAKDPNVLLVDFHSHTRYSHDGRPSFSPMANERWHASQGYQAAFITDHNQVAGAETAKADSRTLWLMTGYRSLQGEEISLAKTHLVVLGNIERINNTPFDSDPAKIPLFIAFAHQQGLPVIASLPEYWQNHWGSGMQDFVRWGIDGFEIVNSTPKALDFPIQKRLQVVSLCKKENLFMTGISDNHGYGYATAAWNAMTLPEWSALDPDQLETAILDHLRVERFTAVTVLEHPVFLSRNPLELTISPFGHLYYYWRSLTPWQALSWVIWIGVLSVALKRYVRKN